jgi:adenylate cyclase
VSTAPPKLERVERASLAQLRDELRTPATAIVSYSQMLLADLVAPDRERLRADLDRIRKAGELVGARIEHLLDPDHPTWRASGPERERMVSRMRHDLRTPLNAVIGYSELILEEQITSDEDHAVAADVRRILASGRHLLFAVDGLVRSAAADGSPSGGFGRHSSTAQEVLAKLRPVEADPGAIPLRQGRVLVIDDVEANRELIAHQLARQGYTVARAASGREGLELLAQTEFDVVLSDLMMDEMDGIDLLRRLKNDPALSDVPVIMISALDELDSVVRCIQLGAVDFVVKPVDPVLLAASIGSILELQHLRERERNYAEALQRLCPGRRAAGRRLVRARRPGGAGRTCGPRLFQVRYAGRGTWHRSDSGHRPILLRRRWPATTARQPRSHDW